MANSRRVVLSLLIGYLITIGVTAISVHRAANTVSSADLSEVLGDGNSELSRIRGDLAVFKRRFTNLKVLLYPVRQSARLLFIVPPLERQRQASELLMKRVSADQEIAISALELGESFHSLRNDYLGGSLSIDDVANSGLDEALSSLEAETQDMLAELASASNLRDQIQALGPVGPIRSLDARMTAQEIRLGEIAEFSRLLSTLLLFDISLMSSADAAFDDVEMFLAGEITISDLQDRIDELSALTHQARDLADQLERVSPAGLGDSSEGQLVGRVVDVNVAIDDLISAIGLVASVGSESLDILRTGNGGLFSEGTELSTAIHMLISRREELGDSVDSIVRSVESLRSIRDDQVISMGAFGDLLDDPKLNQLIDMSATLHQVPELIGEILGVDGVERRYLALGQTSDELRAAGGFTSSVWILTFRSGALIQREYFDVATFEDRESLSSYTDPYEELQLHMDAGRMYLRDAGWEPHFPSAAAVAADIYTTTTGIEIDGVISLTQLALMDLTEAIGGITIDSRVVGSDELLSVMESGTDENGTEFLTTLFDALMDSVSGDRVRDNFIGLLNTMSGLFASQDLMLFSTDRGTEKLILDVGWGGQMNNPPQDRLHIIDSNVGWNKVDRNISRQFKYSVDLSDLTAPEASLELTYVNDSQPVELSANCDVQSHRPELYAYTVLLNGCYWNYIRVYLPGGAKLLSSDELPLQAGAIAARVGRMTVGQPTVQQLFDDNGDYLSGLLVIDSQEMETVRLNYSLPGRVISTSGDRVEYALEIGAQPGTRGRAGSVELIVPDGYEPVEFDPESGVFANGVLTFDLDLIHDESIWLKLQSNR